MGEKWRLRYRFAVKKFLRITATDMFEIWLCKHNILLNNLFQPLLLNYIEISMLSLNIQFIDKCTCSINLNNQCRKSNLEKKMVDK